MKLSLAYLERWLWYIFLATFAWQTRIILWRADASFIEWRSMSLYASDVLMLGLLILALVHIVRIRAWRYRPHWDAGNIVLLLFLVAALLSIRNSDQFVVSVYQWYRLAIFVLLFFYVRYRAVRFDADTSLLAFVFGGLVQSTLALAQYALQHDVGLRWLGETLLNPQMRGVAVFYDLTQTKILRAYGTLPHPNVLAVYLLCALWALAYLYLRHSHAGTRHGHLVWVAAGVPMLWALYLTYSRTMIVVGLAATAVFAIVMWSRSSAHWSNSVTVRIRARHIIIVWAIASVVFGGLFWRQIAARAWISSNEEAVRLRVYYARQALGSGGSRLLNLNWTGVGIGNFTTWLQRNDPGHPSWVYQPAHNLYLLVYSEIGIIGVGLFLAWLVLILRQAIRNPDRPPVVRWGLVMVLVSFLIIALFDHFFWTLQQGRILFWLALAIIAG